MRSWAASAHRQNPCTMATRRLASVWRLIKVHSLAVPQNFHQSQFYLLRRSCSRRSTASRTSPPLLRGRNSSARPAAMLSRPLIANGGKNFELCMALTSTILPQEIQFNKIRGCCRTVSAKPRRELRLLQFRHLLKVRSHPGSAKNAAVRRRTIRPNPIPNERIGERAVLRVGTQVQRIHQQRPAKANQIRHCVVGIGSQLRQKYTACALAQRRLQCTNRLV